MSNYIDKRKMQFWSESSIIYERVNYISKWRLKCNVQLCGVIYSGGSMQQAVNVFMLYKKMTGVLEYHEMWIQWNTIYVFLCTWIAK